IPPNVKFEIDDAEQRWTFPEEFFDLIHMRTMTGCIRDWEKLFTQAFHHTKPGGYIESQEMDYMAVVQSDSKISGESLILWCELQGKAAYNAGLSLRTSGEKLKALMEKVGYVDVVVQEFKLAVGPWPANKSLRNAGLLQLRAMLEGIEELSLRLFTHYADWTIEELHVLLVKVGNELKSKDLHAYWPV
ncbi:hypothetical protein K432DRAFT_315905, partial [Lepidopterella palustris CBS 459.81]